MRCWTSEFDVVVNRHAIMKNSDASGTKQLAIFRESRAVKYDVEALPLAGRRFLRKQNLRRRPSRGRLRAVPSAREFLTKWG